MWRRRLGTAAQASILAAAAGGCFSGEATLGAICGDDLDCGAEQICVNEVCGRCGDGVPQRGELCIVSAQPVSDAPRASPGDLLVLDVENDGHPDLVTRGETGAPELWSGDGSGWTRQATLSVGGTAGLMRLAVLEPGEPLALVVVDADAPALHVGRSDGAGSWAFDASIALDEVPLDLAVAGAPWLGPAWIAWVDAAGLQQVILDPSTGTPSEPLTVAPAGARWLSDPLSLNGDEIVDLAVADVEGRRLEPWLGDGAGGLAPGTPVALEARPIDVATHDVNGDGEPDLLVSDEDGGVSVVVAGEGGSLSVVERMVVSGEIRGVAVADLDRNTERDVVVLTGGRAPLSVFLGRGPVHPDALLLPLNDEGGSLVALDRDRDGLTELLIGPAAAPGELRVLEVEP